MSLGTISTMFIGQVLELETVFYHLLPIASQQVNHPDVFQSMRRLTCASMAEAHQPRPFHHESNRPLLVPDIRHEYAARCAYPYHRKHPDKNAIEHRDCRHDDGLSYYA
uniref:Uncharacterized protein n=1 Tax=Kuenenia stuttgartiensis TaxID=174633 RepID=Q1Q3Z5_KUEST|nr:unknown protein [Candidatus Kuenenia stuttgartiensis]